MKRGFHIGSQETDKPTASFSLFSLNYIIFSLSALHILFFFFWSHLFTFKFFVSFLLEEWKGKNETMFFCFCSFYFSLTIFTNFGFFYLCYFSWFRLSLLSFLIQIFSSLFTYFISFFANSLSFFLVRFSLFPSYLHYVF